MRVGEHIEIINNIELNIAKITNISWFFARNLRFLILAVFSRAWLVITLPGADFTIVKSS